jgi:hypothetical protein
MIGSYREVALTEQNIYSTENSEEPFCEYEIGRRSPIEPRRRELATDLASVRNNGMAGWGVGTIGQ